MSLVELLCVVAVLGILASAAISKLQPTEEMELNLASLTLAADLRWLQQKSINMARGHRDVQAYPIQLIPKLHLLTGAGGGYSIRFGSDAVKTYYFAKKVRVEEVTYGAIYFNNDGHINRPVTIALVGDHRRREVIVDRVGRIRVQ